LAVTENVELKKKLEGVSNKNELLPTKLEELLSDKSYYEKKMAKLAELRMKSRK